MKTTTILAAALLALIALHLPGEAATRHAARHHHHAGRTHAWTHGTARHRSRRHGRRHGGNTMAGRGVTATSRRHVHARHGGGPDHAALAAMARSAAARDGTGVVRTAMRYMARGNPTGHRGPWCAYFMNKVLREAGYRAPTSGYAPAYARYGRGSGPSIGAIAVFRGHVGLVVGRVGSTLAVLSGNYSHRVGLGSWSTASVVSYRSPTR